MELFTPEGLAHIASTVGIPLYLDKFTEQCRRIDIAKVCVEVTKYDHLPSSIEVNIEGMDQLCIAVDYLGSLRYIRCVIFLVIVQIGVLQNKFGSKSCPQALHLLL